MNKCKNQARIHKHLANRGARKRAKKREGRKLSKIKGKWKVSQK